MNAKIVFLGNAGVGKTSIVTRITTGKFSDFESSTIGSSYSTINKTIDKKNYRLCFWDTAGQERFRSIVPMYLRNSHICVIVFDKENFDDILYHKSVVDEISPSTFIFFVRNKIDVDKVNKNFENSLSNILLSNNVYQKIIYTSAKTEEGIKELISCILQKIKELELSQENPFSFEIKTRNDSIFNMYGYC